MRACSSQPPLCLRGNSFQFQGEHLHAVVCPAPPVVQRLLDCRPWLKPSLTAATLEGATHACLDRAPENPAQTGGGAQHSTRSACLATGFTMAQWLDTANSRGRNPTLFFQFQETAATRAHAYVAESRADHQCGRTDRAGPHSACNSSRWW